MASNNFLQWNPSVNNQESDGAYLVDGSRVNGVPYNPAGTVFPSLLANKFFFQLASMCSALAQMMTNKGYTVLDGSANVTGSDWNALVAVLINLCTAVDQQTGRFVYGPDTGGAANAYAVAYTPAIAALVDGMVLDFEAANTSTGASTFSPNGLTAYPIIGGGNLSALQGGEIAKYGKCVVQWSAHFSSWLLIGAAGGPLQVSDATQSKQAVNRESGDARYAALAGLFTQVFSAANGTSGKQVVNISQFTSNLAVNGFRQLPDGSIEQWGYVNFGAEEVEGLYGPYSFPIAFPNACLNISLTILTSEAPGSVSGGDNHVDISTSYLPTKTQFWVWNNSVGGGSTNGLQGFYWRAIGY